MLVIACLFYQGWYLLTGSRQP